MGLGWPWRDRSRWIVLYDFILLLFFTLFFGRFTPLIILFKSLFDFILIYHNYWLLRVFHWHLLMRSWSQICRRICLFTQRFFKPQFLYFLGFFIHNWKMSFSFIHFLYFSLNTIIIKLFIILLSIKKHLRLSKYFVFRTWAFKYIRAFFNEYVLTAVLLG